MHVNERLPLSLRYRVMPPRTAETRWANDAAAGDVPDGTTLSSTMPGGHEGAGTRLARETERAWPDLVPFSDVIVEGVDGTVAWHGRFQRDDRESGSDSSISPTLVGWQAHLSDDTSAQMMPVDRDLNSWKAASDVRKAAATSTEFRDPRVEQTTPSEAPELWTTINGPSARGLVNEAWYDSPTIDLERVFFQAAKFNPAGGATFTAEVFEFDDYGGTSGAVLLNNTTVGFGGNFASVSANKRAVTVRLNHSNTITDDQRGWRWGPLAIYGRHPGVIIDPNSPAGVFGHSIVEFAVGRWAPLLTIGEIQASSFAIPHTGLLTPTVQAIIDATIARYDDADWAVWGREFSIRPRGSGRRWLARVGPEQLRSTGSDAERVFNAAIVFWTDLDGTQRSIGPPGSGMQIEDASLFDSDPENPATAAGITKPLELEVTGTAIAAIAAAVGRRALTLSRRVDNSGQAAFTGYATDFDTGAEHPAWRVKAGDEVIFVDSSRSEPRFITRDVYDGRDTTEVSLDAPPDDLAKTLERMRVSVVGRRAV